MFTAIGVVMTEHIVAGRFEGHTTAGEMLSTPGSSCSLEEIWEVPSGHIVELIADQVLSQAGEQSSALEAIGVAVPGIIRNGIVEDSPNLPHLKGMRLREELAHALALRGLHVPVHVCNDADAIAAGVAATRGQLDRLTRVWTLGNGVGYGRWPYVDGIWEGGHITVTLDPTERYCGCGGVGHLEGILGHRAMRLRFLDLEPEEVFALAQEGDPRCREFVLLCHRALAAATASFIHLAGPGRFYFTGPHVGFLEIPLLHANLEQMVRLSPLQSYSLEILPEDDATAILGASVTALAALETHL